MQQRTAVWIVLAGLAIANPAAAQERPGARPTPVVSPEVQADRRVTFRLRVPAAKEVKVTGEWPGGTQAMTKDERGLWSITVGPLPPDLYGYSFLVDGLRILDPGNRNVKPMRSPTTSILEVPGDPPRLHEFQDVPHGTVRVHEYRSKALGRRRGLYVYTPPGYDRQADARYPVLYLFHGSGDTEATWTVLGRAHLILDNLLARKKARPMVIVMPDGHAAPPPGASTGGRSQNLEAFARDLLEDVLPFVEANYRVRAEAASRAIVGLSMGGGQSLTIGLKHPELFSWVGGFSAAVFDPETTLATTLADPQATNAKLRLLWFACGKDDRLIENNRRLAELLTKHGIRHEFRTTEGNHSWPVWRRYLAEFVPLLFQERARGAGPNEKAPQQSSAEGRRLRVVLTQELKEKVDGKGAQVVMVELTFAPGASSPRHRHAGPVFGYVLEGTLEFQIEGQPLKTLRPGETFYEPAGVVHAVSRNPSKDKPAKFLAVLLTEKGAKPLTTYLKE